jgi:hypothetical protein
MSMDFLMHHEEGAAFLMHAIATLLTSQASCLVDWGCRKPGGGAWTSGALSVDVILASAWLIVKRIESEGVETMIRTGIGFLILLDRLKSNPKNLKCGNWC